MKRVDLAIIGGSGLESLLKDTRRVEVGTPYGFPSNISIGKVEGRLVAFLPRHGFRHSIPPHKVNYRANVYALFRIGVKRILGTNAVGAINKDYKPGELVVPNDFLDFTKNRVTSFYDNTPVTHIDMSPPFCPEIRAAMIETTKRGGLQIRDSGVIVCTEGPRFETPAEIEMFERLGCDLVGMTIVPEAVLARELEICYATLCFISNMAAGMQQRLTAQEVARIAEEKMPDVKRILEEVVKNLPKTRKCPCTYALKNARFRS